MKSLKTKLLVGSSIVTAVALFQAVKNVAHHKGYMEGYDDGYDDGYETAEDENAGFKKYFEEDCAKGTKARTVKSDVKPNFPPNAQSELPHGFYVGKES